jgi:hypothetical protein
MIVKSLNLIAPDINNTIYNISVNNSGTMVIAQNIDPNAIGVMSIALSEKYTLRLTDAGNVELVDKEFIVSPEYVPLWFYSPNGTTYRVTASDAGVLVIEQATYTRQSGTPFYAIYCRFLSKITDDLYLEWTLEDTFKNLESIFLDILPRFEWPKFALYNYSTQAIGMVAADGSVVSYGKYLVDLTIEELDIFAGLMSLEWINRQILSVNLTRMKYSSKDFQFTSQANHIEKLLNTKKHFEQENKSLQRMYQRRSINPTTGKVQTNYAGLASSAITERWRLAYSGTGYIYGSAVIGGAWWTEGISSIYGGYSIGDPYTEAYLSALGGSSPLINPRDVLV